VGWVVFWPRQASRRSFSHAEGSTAILAAGPIAFARERRGMPMDRGFTWLDWLVLGGYFIALAAIGILVSRRKAASEDYFLGGRRMPVWAVAASLIATTTSAATFIGGPEEAYVGDLTYISTNIGVIIAVVVVALLFIPAFYRHNVTTVYDLLEHRFGARAKLAASWTFMIGRVFASGARIYVAAIPAAMILYGTQTEARHVLPAIAILTVVGILTAFGGGIRTVIWTDVMQVCVFLLAAAAALFILFQRIPLGAGEIYSALSNTPVGSGSKMRVLEVGIDPSKPGWGFEPAKAYTLLTAVFGFSLLNLAAYGTDHDLTQRMLTCRNALKGGSSAFAALLINIPMLAAFMTIGLLLYVFYQRPDLMGAAAPSRLPEKSSEVFLRFIIDQMPPGLTGLMMAGLFAVGVGSLNSALAAMSATFVNDAYRPFRPGMSDRHYVFVGRAAVVGWGIILGAFACWCYFWHGEETLIRFVLRVMTFAYAGLLGVFLTALCTRRGNCTSAIAALVVGFLLVLLMEPAIWQRWAGMITWSVYTPTSSEVVSLADFRIAFPWRLTIATAGAFLVCLAGTPGRKGGGHA
jgi:SSS family transporter